MKGRKAFTQQEANAIIKLIRQKLLADTNGQKKVRDKIRGLGFYATDFGIGGGYNEHDFLSVIDIVDKGSAPPPVTTVAENGVKPKPARRKGSDEHYVIDLCDEVLGQRALRQHRFSFLLGDSGMPLPVDAYYPSLALAVEYHEKQHTSEVSFWDSKPTISGMTRAEQRRLYDERRRKLIPANGIRLVVIDYTHLSHNHASKKLLREIGFDRKALEKILKTNGITY